MAVDAAQPFDVVVERLRAAGLEVTQTLPVVGTIVGLAQTSALDRLAGVDGASAVERSAEYQLPPPESEVQ